MQMVSCDLLFLTAESLDAEWMDEDGVDTTGLSIPSTSHQKSGLSIVTETLEDPWE